MSSSLAIKYSLLSILISFGPYLVKITMSPFLTSRCIFLPSLSRRPAPTATTLPFSERSFSAVSGRIMPPFFFSSRRGSRRIWPDNGLILLMCVCSHILIKKNRLSRRLYFFRHECRAVPVAPALPEEVRAVQGAEDVCPSLSARRDIHGRQNYPLSIRR